MAEPLVTVIIPTRNRLTYLQEAVGSVRRQTYSRWQLVVVDDASEDGTWEWLQRLADLRIRVLRQPGRGERCAARNRGLAEAQGEYVLFLDDDDRLTEQAIATLVRAITRHPGATLAIGARVLFDEAGNSMRMPHPRIPFVRRAPWCDVFLGWEPVPGQTMFRVATLREAGGWDERLVITEDQELLLRVGLRGTCVIVPRVVLENRAHSGQWRTRDVAAVEEVLRREFVSHLADGRRELGQRLLVTRAFLKQAYEAYQARRFLQTARLVKRAAWKTPEVLWSPIVGANLLALWLRALVGIAFGRKVFAAARALRRAARQTCGSEVVPNPRIVDRSAGLER